MSELLLLRLLSPPLKESLKQPGKQLLCYFFVITDLLVELIVAVHQVLEGIFGYLSEGRFDGVPGAIFELLLESLIFANFLLNLIDHHDLVLGE